MSGGWAFILDKTGEAIPIYLHLFSSSSYHACEVGVGQESSCLAMTMPNMTSAPLRRPAFKVVHLMVGNRHSE